MRLRLGRTLFAGIALFLWGKWGVSNLAFLLLIEKAGPINEGDIKIVILLDGAADIVGKTFFRTNPKT